MKSFRMILSVAAFVLPLISSAAEYVSIGVCVEVNKETNKFYILRDRLDPKQGLFVLAFPDADLITAESLPIDENEEEIIAVVPETSLVSQFIHRDIIFSKKGPTDLEGVYRRFTCRLK